MLVYRPENRCWLPLAPPHEVGNDPTTIQHFVLPYTTVVYNVLLQVPFTLL